MYPVEYGMRYLLLLFVPAALFGQPSSRELNDIGWMEFRELVPSKIHTVLIPTGTMEPHGVINNGADNTAPFAMAKTIARRTNAMIAPTLPYGITGSLEAYPGAFQITEAAYPAGRPRGAGGGP